MKKLLLTTAVFGSLASFVACNKTAPTPPPVSLAPIEVVTQVEAPPPSSLTLESLDKRVSDIETRMAKARAWKKHH